MVILAPHSKKYGGHCPPPSPVAPPLVMIKTGSYRINFQDSNINLLLFAEIVNNVCNNIYISFCDI